MTSTGDVILDTQLEHGYGLLRQGRLEDAELTFQRVLEKLPEHVDSLNAVGMAALRRGDRARAIAMLRKAAAVAPQDSMTWTNLGHVLDASQDAEGALEAYQTAVAIDNGNYIALLHRGLQLERLGRHSEALPTYFKAITAAQARGRWTQADTTPPGILPVIRAAMQYVNKGRRELFGRLIEPLQAIHGKQALSRVAHALACYLGDEQPAYVDARQRPTFLFFPGLPTTPYFDRALFSWIPDLEANTEVIRQELKDLLDSAHGREPVFHSEALAEANLRGAQGGPQWTGYYFYRYGESRSENAERCPQTQRSIDAIADVARIREHAPEILFSVFTPGTHLLPHCGVTNTRVVAHLPLIVPTNCALSVAGLSHEWQEGKVVVFDDTFPHEAWNRSDRMRVVLIVDVWNPHLSPVERLAVAELVGGIGDFRKKADATAQDPRGIA